VSERYPDALLIFIDAPSRDEQQRRLEGRGDPPDKVAARMAKGDEERLLAADLGAAVVVNNDLDQAVGDVAAIIADRRLRASDPRPGSA
jgi:guanylate kinase